MIQFNPLPLLIGSILISIVFAFIPAILFFLLQLYIVNKSDSDMEMKDISNTTLICYIMFILTFTIIAYNLGEHAEYLNQYAAEYDQIYYIKVNNEEIYSTDLQMSGENIIINDINGNYHEISRDQSVYKIEYKKSPYIEQK